MLVKVERKHIEGGKLGSWTSCPVALALRDAGVGLRVVYPRQVLLEDGTTVNLPRNAFEFIYQFDTGELKNRLKPFDFEFVEQSGEAQ